MKKMFYIPFLVCIVVSLWTTSCKEEKVLQIRSQNFVDIEELKAMYQGAPVTLENKSQDSDLFTGGIVISNADQGNNPEGVMVIQSETRGKLRGIAIAIDDYLERYKIGDSVVVRIDGKVLERKNGFLQVSGLTPLDVGKISENNEQRIHVDTDDIGIILTDKDVYENTLIRVRDVNLVGAVRGQTYGEGDITLSNGTSDILLKTNEAATFASSEVLKSGDFTGILLQTAFQEPYLSIRSSADYDGIQFPPVNYDGFPEGFEVADPFASGPWVLTAAARNGSATVHLKRGTTGVISSGGNPPPAGSITMDFDLMYGASQFSLYFGQATTSNNDSNGSTIYVDYSQDGGQTWTALVPTRVRYTLDGEVTWTTVTPPVSDPTALVVVAAPGGVAAPERQRLYFAEYDDLNIEGTVRFRVRRPASTSRIMVDDIFIKPNAD